MDVGAQDIGEGQYWRRLADGQECIVTGIDGERVQVTANDGQDLREWTTRAALRAGFRRIEGVNAGPAAQDADRDGAERCAGGKCGAGGGPSAGPWPGKSGNSAGPGGDWWGLVVDGGGECGGTWAAGGAENRLAPVSSAMR